MSRPAAISSHSSQIGADINTTARAEGMWLIPVSDSMIQGAHWFNRVSFEKSKKIKK